VEFYRLDIETGNAEMLHRTRAQLQGRPQLSRDGKFIVYSEDNSAETVPSITSRLVRFDIEPRRETELKKGEWYQGVGVSPDSRQISALVHMQPGPASSIVVMPAEGGAAREIYRASPWDGYSRSMEQVWTPDQRYLLVVRPESGAYGAPSVLWKISVAGGSAERIGISMNARLGLSMTADAKRLFLSAVEEGPNEVWALDNFLPKLRSTK
jgi:Tol biopolymer transport system component